MFKLFREKLKNVFSKLKKDVEEKAEEEIKEIKQEEQKIEEKLERLGEKKDHEQRAQIPSDKEIKKLEKEEEKLKQEIQEIKTEEPEVKEKKSFFGLIKEKFTTTKLNEDEFEEMFKVLEVTLMENSVAVSVIDEIKKKLSADLIDKPISKKEIETIIKETLREVLSKILIEPFDFLEKVKSKKPFVIVFFGINGAGKTTAIAKVAHLLQKSKLKCVLAAADTFRAASIEQLEKHASKLNVSMIKHQYGADPAAVAFDAIAHAKSAGKDVVLIDTAGRMHTKTDLMREMEKIVRVSKPDLKIFVGESITGNDATEQAGAFNKAIGIDAIILTKADVDEKGGAMISVSKVTGKPILFLGTGQGYDDLEVFSKEKIIKTILD
jgi:fused signal recognition particle receptor